MWSSSEGGCPRRAVSSIEGGGDGKDGVLGASAVGSGGEESWIVCGSVACIYSRTQVFQGRDDKENKAFACLRLI